MIFAFFLGVFIGLTGVAFEIQKTLESISSEHTINFRRLKAKNATRQRPFDATTSRIDGYPDGRRSRKE